jgi:hypothetical protein
MKQEKKDLRNLICTYTSPLYSTLGESESIEPLATRLNYAHAICKAIYINGVLSKNTEKLEKIEKIRKN